MEDKIEMTEEELIGFVNKQEGEFFITIDLEENE